MQCRPFIMAIILVAVFALTACSGADSPQENLEKGRALVAQKQYSEAIILFKNVLSESPTLIAARFELGQVYYALGDLPAAERFLLNAYDAQYLPEKVVPLLAATYFYQKDTLGLKTLLEDQHSDTANADFHLQLSLYKILFLSRDNQVGEAQQALSTLVNELGASAQTCEFCMTTQAHIQSYSDPSAAISTLDKLIIDYPQNAQAYLLRGQLYFALQNFPQAMNDFQRFQLMQPRTAYVQFLLAITELQMKNTPKATEYVDNLLASNPQQPLVNHLKAMLVFDNKDYLAAKGYAEKSISNGLKSPANFLIAGVSAYHLAQLESAYGHLLKAAPSYPENAELKRLITLIQFKFGNLKMASKGYLQQNVSDAKDALFGNLMAYELLQDGQFDEAEDVLKYLTNTPISQPIIQLQTQALQKQIDLKKALSMSDLDLTPQSVAEVNKQTAGVDEKLMRILFLIDANALIEAQTQAEQWLVQSPNNVDALNVSAYVFQQLGQRDEATSLFKQALQINPDNTASIFFMAQVSAAAGDNQHAEAYYRRILKTTPDNLAALRELLQLTFLSQEQPNWDELLQALDLSEVSDDQVVAIADALFKWQEYTKLDSFLAGYKPVEQWTDMVWMVWLKNSYFLHGVDKFRSNFTLFYQKNSLPIHVLFALSVLETPRQFELMLKIIQQLPEDIQNTDAVLMQKLLALVELKRFDQVQDLLNFIGDNPVFRKANWYIKGKLMEDKGDFAQAANYLTSYYKSQANFHSVSNLASVFVKASRNDELVSLANEYVKNNQSDTTACLSLALKLAPTHPNVALTLLESKQLQWLIWRNWKLSNNLAWLYLQQNKPNKALKFSTNAIALKPNNKQVQSLYAKILNSL